MSFVSSLQVLYVLHCFRAEESFICKAGYGQEMMVALAEEERRAEQDA
jgi:hypothetical protein